MVMGWRLKRAELRMLVQVHELAEWLKDLGVAGRRRTEEAVKEMGAGKVVQLV